MFGCLAPASAVRVTTLFSFPSPLGLFSLLCLLFLFVGGRWFFVLLLCCPASRFTGVRVIVWQACLPSCSIFSRGPCVWWLALAGLDWAGFCLRGLGVWPWPWCLAWLASRVQFGRWSHVLHRCIIVSVLRQSSAMKVIVLMYELKMPQLRTVNV